MSTHAATGPADSASPDDLRAARLLERDAELQVLESCVASAVRGEHPVVIVEGLAGVGKTSLLEVAVMRAHDRGIRTLSAAGHELEQAIPGALARRLIVPALEAMDGRSRARLLRGLRPVLAPLLEGTPLHGEAATEDPTVMLTSALATLFERALGSGDGTLIVVDDAHWADPLSLRLISYLLLAHEELPMALILAVRPDGEASPALHALRASPLARVLRPQSLSAVAVRRLVVTELPGAEPAFCELCVRATAGNPFLLDAMLRSLRDDGVAGTAADAARLDAFVPDSVLSSVLVRLARCSRVAASLARAAAVLGEAPLRQAAALAGLDPLGADAAADELVTAGFVHPGEPLAFTHPLVRAAIYRDQTGFARARGHRRAAEILHAEGDGVESVSAHLMLCRCECDPWVARTLGEAGQRALASGDPGTATVLLERALKEPPEHEDRADLLVALADARAAKGAPDAIEPLQDALDLIDDPRRRAAALHNLGILLLTRHDLPGAAACAQRGLAELDSCDASGEVDGCDPLAGALEGILLASAVLVPELHEQVDVRIEALRSAALEGCDPSDPVTLAVVALHMIDRGDDRQVIGRLARSAFVESTNRPAARAATINHLGSVLVYGEDLGEADELLTEAITQAEALGRTVTAGFARVWRAQARLRCGRLEDAIADGELALGLRHFGWQFHVGPCLAVLVEALLERGDLPRAQAMLQIGEQTCDVPRQPLLLRARARLSMAAGNDAAAITDIRTADQFLRDTHDLDNPVILPWRTELARVLARAGRADEATQLALEEAGVSRAFGSVRAEGIALAAAGTTARDVDTLQRAVELLERTPAALEHARALVELGATLRRQRERAAAREPLRRALELATRLGAVPLAQRAHDELGATGARPRRIALDGVESLTATERRIAQLAATGLSNREIAATLVVTPKTIEWHLGRIYGKLGVTGRRQLATVELDGPSEQVQQL